MIHKLVLGVKLETVGKAGGGVITTLSNPISVDPKSAVALKRIMVVAEFVAPKEREIAVQADETPILAPNCVKVEPPSVDKNICNISVPEVLIWKKSKVAVPVIVLIST